MNLSDISSVIVYGHSCSIVDKRYFEVISRYVRPDALWSFFVHDPNKKDYYELFANSIKSDNQKKVILNS